MLSTLLIISEIVLVTRTSALSMGVIGGAKEVMQIFLAVLLLSDRVSAVSAGGVALAVVSSIAYAVIRRRVRSPDPAYAPVAVDEGALDPPPARADAEAAAIEALLEDIVPLRGVRAAQKRGVE